MAINWSRTWSRLNDDDALAKRKNSSGGIDWETTRGRVRQEMTKAYQAEVKAASEAGRESEKLKQRKLTTDPIAVRAAKTMENLQEGTQRQSLHPTGGALRLSQDDLRKLGMVNENGFVLGGVDPAKLGLDTEDMAKLGLPTSSVSASGAATFPAKAGKAGGKDYVGYLAGEFGSGMIATPGNILGGATTALGDRFSGGAVSDGMQRLQAYFQSRPQMLDRWLSNEMGVEQMILQETGVEPAALAAYRTANTDDWLRSSLQQDRGANLPQGFRDAAGGIAYTFGTMAPGMAYSWVLPATGAGGDGILGAVVDAIHLKQKVGQAAGKAAMSALKGNISTWLLGASAAGGQLTNLAQERGFGAENYINAAANGFVEYFVEGALGISDAKSLEALWESGGSGFMNILKRLGNYVSAAAEEGLEEVINAPMSGIVDKMTVEPDKKLVGDGGIFDLREMIRSGLSGMAVGLIMGGVGAVSSIRLAVQEGAEIQIAAKAMNQLIDVMPENVKVEKMNPARATVETLEQKQAEVLDKLREATDATSSVSADGAATFPASGEGLGDGTLPAAGKAEPLPSAPLALPPSPQAGKALEDGRQADAVNGQEANAPVQNDAQAMNQNGNMMSASVETAEPEEIRNARELIAQYEANGGALNGQQEGSVFSADGQERQFDQSSGEQTGGMESSTIEPESYTNQRAVAAARQNRLRNIEPSRTSAEWLNLDPRQYDTRKIKLFPEDLWDSQMKSTAQKAYEKGVDVQFYTGDLRAHGSRVNGVNPGDGRILIQADSYQWTVEQLTDHELMHTYLGEEYGLRDEMIRELERTDRERLNQLVLSYVLQYEGVIKASATEADEDLDNYARGYVIDEIICDAYAGMNRRGWGATKFSDTARTTYENRLTGRDAAMSQDVRGPPMDDGEARYRVDGAGSEKARFSVADVEEQTDSEGRKLSAQQAEFFRDSKVRVDEYGDYGEQDGSLVPVYHATWNDEFTVFDAGRLGEYTDKNAMDDWFAATAHVGFWFNTQDLSELKKVGKRSEKVYLNIKRPYRAGTLDGLAEDIATWTEDYIEEDTPAERGSVFAKWLEWNGYDGVMLNDEELGGVSFVALYPEQIKRVSNTRPTEAADIRYSVASESDAEQEDGAMADEGTDADVAATEEADAADKPDSEAEEAAKHQEKRVRKSATARKELRSDLMNLFSVPEGMRAEVGDAIESYAAKMLERGRLSNGDRDMLFDILHSSGVMEIPASEYQKAQREAVKGQRIYVPESLKAEFGDDWNEFRREAFAAGIYLTNNQNDPDVSVWNQDMALMFPGAFDENETDGAWILRNIVNVAQQGKTDKMSLSEYATSLAEEYGPGVIDDYYTNMERQMDQLLTNFADKANLEIKIRERTENQLRRDAEYRKEQREKQRQRKELRELQQKTMKQLQWLNKNRNKAPKDLKEKFDAVLGDIDLFAIGAANEMNYSERYEATWKDLAYMYKEAQDNDPNWLPSKELERIVTRLNAPKLEDLDVDTLNDLFREAVGLHKELADRRRMLEYDELIEEVYEQSVKEIAEADGGYTGTKRDWLMNLQQLTPMNIIERMAGWNKDSAWLSMGRQLEQGERDTKKFVIQSNKMLQEFVEKNADWIKTADGNGKDSVWYKYELPELTGFRRGDAPIFSDNRITVYMTPMMRVQLYMESKSYDNLNHMLGGRRFADKDLYTKADGDPQKRREAMAKGQIVRLTPEMVRDMVKDLTPQEQELAHILGDLYYNEFAKKEINRVSNILYGYDKAMESWYTPIYTDQSFNKSEPGKFDATAEGAGNLKERIQMSTNPSLNLSALDAFEKSVGKTSKFVGMSIPIRNWNTLMNWRGKTDSMKDTIDRKWGEEMQRYLEDLVVRLQNPPERNNTVLDNMLNSALSNYISAVFGLNPLVVAKQFGSYFMAMPYLGVNNMPTPKQIKNADPKLIAKYSPELDDRMMGYAIPEVSQLKKKPNWSQKNKAVEFLAGGGAITAMDSWTAKTLWPWAENKVAKESGLQRGTEEFYKRVAVEFNDAIVRSQSINDVMHRSTLMNSQNAATRAFTMFKTDSAQSYNMLREAFGEAQYMKQHGTEEQKRAANKKAAQALLGVAANNLWSAAINLLMNLWKAKGKNYRDDEGELTAASVAAQYSEDVLTSMAGIVIGGEEISDALAGLIGGEKFYGIELAGGDQLDDIVDEIISAGNGMRDILVDAYYIVSNDGNLGEYLEDRAPDMFGAAKQMAQKIGKYFAGLPLDNLEAYLIGTLRWAAPQAVAAYEDALKSPDGSGLKGLSGAALETRISNILDDRMGGAEDATTSELARLYEAGFTSIVPPEDADKIGDRVLNADEQQIYRMSVADTVGRYLDDFISSDAYDMMGDEEKVRRIGTLYSYAKDVARAEITGEEPEASVERIDDLVDSGMGIGEALAVYANYERASRLLKAGVDPEYVTELVRSIQDAEDANGPDESLGNLERYQIMIDCIGDEGTRYAAMAGLMQDKELARFRAGYGYIDSGTYVEFLTMWKASYPGESKSQERVEAVLNAMSISPSERAALWQMSNASWKPDNNPYSKTVGREVAELIAEYYAELEDGN